MTITDIYNEIYTLTDSDSVSYPTASILRRINAALEEIVGKIIGLDGTWQFDDSNFTDFPIGVTDLVNSQNDYAFDVAMLSIERVEILNKDGIWRLLSPIDKSHIDGAISEYRKTDGIPEEYDKQGASILLYPAPDNGVSVTLTAGLKVYFQRTASIFTAAQVTTGTKVPGFASPFHILLCYKAALPFCLSYKKDRVVLYEKKIMDLDKDLIKFYSLSEKDTRKIISNKSISFR